MITLPRLRSALMFPALLLAMVALTIPAPPATAATVQRIHMSPTGDDANDGSQASPVRTLQRVQAIVAQTNLSADVEVRIAGGTYVQSPVTWTTYRPGHTISFMPADYTPGEGRDGFDSMPIFENKRADGSGRYLTGAWLTACLPSDGPLSEGGDGGLRFYYLQVQKYANAGLSITGTGRCSGSYAPSSGPGQPSARGLDGTTVFGMVFTDIGNLYTGGRCDTPDFLRCGYGGIVLTESSHNSIRNNHFIDLRNSENSYIHALYITHKSSHNTFHNNNVTGVSAGPVKVRDASNFNSVEYNTFGANHFHSRTITTAHYDEQVATSAGECSSYGNRFAYNDLGTYLINSSANLPAWMMTGDARWKGSNHCPDLPSDRSRLTTAGNYY